MACLLLREKKFIELNEAFNKMSMQSAHRSNFQTYFKQKETKPSNNNRKPNKNLLSQCDDMQQHNVLRISDNSIADCKGSSNKTFKPEINYNLHFKNDSTKQNLESSVITRTECPTHEVAKLKGGVSISNQVNKEVSTSFLKKKIQILEEGRDQLAHDINQQKEINTQTFLRNKQMEQQLDLAVSKNNLLVEQLRKSEILLEQSNLLYKERSLENFKLQNDLQASRNIELNLNQTIATLEKRLSRANEIIEASKVTLENLKFSENENLKTKRRNIDKMITQINSLKKQRMILLSAMKKQFLLMKNLKRQNVFMEQAYLQNICEQDFLKVLSWKKST